MLSNYRNKQALVDCVRVVCGADVMVAYVDAHGDHTKELAKLARQRWGVGTLGVLVKNASSYVCQWTKELPDAEA